VVILVNSSLTGVETRGQTHGESIVDGRPLLGL